MKQLASLPANARNTDSVYENDPNYPIKLAVVDDDQNELLLTSRAVDRSPDLERVGSYTSGLEALRGIPASASEVVLSDICMPGMSGIELTQRLRDVRPGLFICLISGFDQPDAAAQALKAGADAYLKKPFSLSRFFETLTACLRHRRLGAPTKGSELPGTVRPLSSRREQEQRPLIDAPTVSTELLRIVTSLEDNFHTRQDMLQEGLLYLWSKLQRSPGRALGWYLKAAKFHLQNLRKSGRSLDSSKRHSAQVAIPAHCDQWDHWRDSLEFDEGFLSAVVARDLLSVLANRLEPIDRTVLEALAEGQEVRDIANKLHVSQMFVVRHRRRIGELASALA